VLRNVKDLVFWRDGTNSTFGLFFEGFLGGNLDFGRFDIRVGRIG